MSNYSRTIANVKHRRIGSAKQTRISNSRTINAAIKFDNKQAIGRATKKSELRNLVDRSREEALGSKMQLQATKASVFVLFKKIQKNYKKSVKKAAKRIVNEGCAEQYLE